VNSENFCWKTFFFFYELGIDYALAAMPQINKIIDIHLEE